jgi:diacylglycerol O-acyltransferase / wax synthase
MLGYYPLSIVVHGMALNITVHSYAGHLDFGLVACARAVPDLAPLADAICEEHAALKALAAQTLLGPVKAAPRASTADNTVSKSAAKAVAKAKTKAKVAAAPTPKTAARKATTSTRPARGDA